MEELEILKLKTMLEEAKIPFDYNDKFHKDGYQIIIEGKQRRRLCDVVYHSFSYGYEDNKLEIMGGLTEEENEFDGVLGWLTAEEVFKRFKYCYENNTDIYKEE